MLTSILCAAILAQSGGTESIKPRWVLSGNDAGFSQPQLFLFQSQSEFQSIWTRNRARRTKFPESAPQVDFKKEVVVAYFAGGDIGISKSDIKVLRTEKDFRITFKDVKDPNLNENSGTKPPKTYCYAFAILPRLERPYHIFREQLILGVGYQKPAKLATYDLGPKDNKTKPTRPPAPPTAGTRP